MKKLPSFKNETTESTTEYLSHFFPGSLGIEVVEFDGDVLTCRMEIKPVHLAPNGHLHGGVVVTLADTACGRGAHRLLAEDAVSFSTIEMKTNFLRTVTSGALRCVVTPQHLGRTTHVWDAVVTSEETGKVLALFRCTQAIRYGDSSEASKDR